MAMRREVTLNHSPHSLQGSEPGAVLLIGGSYDESLARSLIHFPTVVPFVGGWLSGSGDSQ